MGYRGDARDQKHRRMTATVLSLADQRARRRKAIITVADAVPVRGYHVAYRPGETHCPGCGRSQWYVGRQSAERAFCATAVPIVEGRRG